MKAIKVWNSQFCSINFNQELVSSFYEELKQQLRRSIKNFELVSILAPDVRDDDMVARDGGDDSSVGGGPEQFHPP